MLSAREAFKAGFLARCVDDRLSPEETEKRAAAALALMDKAAGAVAGALGKGYDLGKSLIGGAIGYGLPAALAAPPIAGGLAGYGLARATDVDDTDVAEVKDREVLDEYRRQAARLRRQTAVREYQKARKRTGRVFV
jgi:hypothetical protein